MADETYYAWAPIRYGVERDKNDNVTKVLTLAAGEKVTQDMIGDDDESWQEKIDGGAVRTMPYPDMPKGYAGSPLDFLREKAKEAEQLATVGAGSNFAMSEEAMLTGAIDLEAPTPAGDAMATADQKRESAAAVKEEANDNK